MLVIFKQFGLVHTTAGVFRFIFDDMKKCLSYYTFLFPVLVLFIEIKYHAAQIMGVPQVTTQK